MLAPIVLTILVAHSFLAFPLVGQAGSTVQTSAQATTDKPWPPAGVVRTGAGVVSPRLIKEAKPRYTREAMDAKIEAIDARLADRLERAVTTMLTGFHSHARLTHVRDTALETRVAEIENRLTDIELLLGKQSAA